MSGTRWLTIRQRQAFHRDGYVAVPGLFKPFIDELLAWTEAISSHPGTPDDVILSFENSQLSGERMIARIENFLPFHKPAERFCRGPLQLACGELFDDQATLFRDKISFKLPGGKGHGPQQDAQSGWQRYAPQQITAMIALDKADNSNGRLEVAAGHHREGLLAAPGEPLPQSLCDRMNWQTVDCQPGDTLFLSSFTPHRSAANLSGNARRQLAVTYNRAADGDHRQHYFEDKRAGSHP